ncbi:MAG: hypothetical protein IBX71_00630 [Candidatus Desulforudis sp.]|nr:hypothetical protein [Desulforudis sp.]
MNRMALGQVVASLRARMAVEAGEIPDLPVRGVAFDSRRVAPGDIFVAVRGFRDDGHRYCRHAAARGAAAIVAEMPAPAGMFRPWLRVSDSRRALAHLAAAFFGHPSTRLKVIGITGTNGKTTTACLLQSVLNAAGRKSGLLGTLVVDTGRRCAPARLTTPEAPEIQGLFQEMCAAGLRHVVMEVSAHGTVLHRITDIDFDVGAVLNVDLDHSDFTPRFEDYVRAKQAFIQMVKPGRPVLLNVDDPTVARFVCVRPDAVTVSVDGAADVTATGVRTENGVTKFLVRVRRPLEGRTMTVTPGEFRVCTALPGRHNVYNVAVAFTAALLTGVEPEAAARAVSGFKGVSRRFEFLGRGEITVLDDTAMNPASIDAVFAAVSGLPFKKVVVVNAIRGNRGPVINGHNAAALARWVRLLGRAELITTSSVSHAGPNDRVGPAEEAAFLNGLRRGGVCFRHHAELDAAVAEAVGRVTPGDLLLLLGAQGMDEGGALAVEMLGTRGITLSPGENGAGHHSAVPVIVHEHRRHGADPAD